MARSLLELLVLLSGGAAVVYGTSLIYVPAAWIVGGVLLAASVIDVGEAKS